MTLEPSPTVLPTRGQLRSLVVRGLSRWRGEGARRIVTWLLLAGCASLFLDSAGTFQVDYTVRPFYVLLAGAVAVGAPVVYKGWLSLPRWVSWPAAALVLVYLASIAFAHVAVLPNDPRAGTSREALYLIDLVLGLGVLGLIAGLLDDTRSERVVAALAIGAALAAAYGLYQWFAQHYNLPLANLDNVAASNGGSAAANQGVGLFGWQRIRGTFLEPHFLGAYLSSLLPLILALVVGRSRKARVAGIAVAALIVASLLLTDSAPSWGALAVGGLTAAAVFAIATGRQVLAALATVLTLGALFIGPLALISPRSLAGITGRNSTQLVLSAQARTETWNAAIRIWSKRPVLGFGPGQSSVRLTQDLLGNDARVLGSAQGLWAASLIDSGVAGLACWALLLVGILVVAVRRVIASPTPLGVLLLAATTTAIFSHQFTGDRLDVWVWALLGVLLAATAHPIALRRSEPVSVRLGARTSDAGHRIAGAVRPGP